MPWHFYGLIAPMQQGEAQGVNQNFAYYIKFLHVLLLYKTYCLMIYRSLWHSLSLWLEAQLLL